jgi:hypothetical protein
MDELEEVGRTADALRTDIETLFVRGLAASAPADRRGLEARTGEWEKVGAAHVATRLRAALKAADADAKDAAYKFLSAYTSLHAFERVLSLEVARGSWEAFLAAREEETEEEAVPSIRQPPAEPPALTLEDPKGTQAALTELARVVEDLVKTGLTTATAATRTKLDAAFKEASKRKLLRLGASLRYVNEEIGRFLADDGSFASRRYAFFLHRSWLLAKGTLHAIGKEDKRLLGSLCTGGGGAPRPITGPLEVVTLGVAKRAVAAACTFDFRLRVVKTKEPALLGRSVIFSLVFARKANVPPEAYLHLPQPQKFAPKIFRDKQVLAVNGGAIIADDRGGGRLVLGPKSTVTPGAAFEKWDEHYGWDPEGAAERVAAHAPTPLDLAVEMQEEAVLDEWQLEKLGEDYRLHAPGLVMNVSVPSGAEGKEMRTRLEAGAKKKKNRARLFGTVHYEFGKMVFSPLSYLEDDGPDYLMLSEDKINLSALMGSLNIGG